MSDITQAGSVACCSGRLSSAIGASCCATGGAGSFLFRGRTAGRSTPAKGDRSDSSLGFREKKVRYGGRAQTGLGSACGGSRLQVQGGHVRSASGGPCRGDVACADPRHGGTDLRVQSDSRGARHHETVCAVDVEGAWAEDRRARGERVAQATRHPRPVAALRDTAQTPVAECDAGCWHATRQSKGALTMAIGMLPTGRRLLPRR